MALYVEHGYEQTTVAEIAERAGVTPRTFFRHFADKREVLFAGSEMLGVRMVAAVDAAPPTSSPMEAIALALDEAASMIGANRTFSRQRQSLITANRELHERELIKLAGLANSLGAALRRRGVSEPQASLAAEAGIAVLRVAFERWLTGRARPLNDVMRECSAALTSLTV